MIGSGVLYWLVKLDDIRGLLAAAIALSVFAVAVCGIIGLMALCESDKDCRESCQAGCRRFGKIAAWVLACSCLARTLLPSTKQVAVIYAVPAVLGSGFVSETVPAEARELYGLAKRWLSEKVEDVESETEKEVSK